MKVIGSQDSLDKAIAIIRKAATPQDAKDGLMKEFELSDIQAQAILDLRLARPGSISTASCTERVVMSVSPRF